MPSTRASGAEIHYEARGNGPPLLLIPGLGLDLGVFGRLVPRLERRFTCIAVDNRGVGRSEAPRGPYTIPELADDAAAVLAAVGAGPAVVLGHSMGGFTALELALRGDGLVRGLLLVSTAAAGGRERLGQDPEVAAALDRRAGTPGEIARGNLAASIGAAFLAAHAEDLERFVAGRLARPARGRGVAGQRAAADAFDAGARLARIRVPTAVAHGEADRVIAPSRAAELAAAIPGAALHLLPAVGHMPFWEAPDRLAEIAKGTFP